MANLGSTATAQDIVATLRKRLETQGHLLTDAQLHTLMLDVMVTITADAGNVLAHAASEVAGHPQRPFQKEV